jgi:hypothetical protein
MRFLLDSSAFALGNPSAEGTFWRGLIPALESQLGSHELVVLGRGGDEPEYGNGVRVLRAPPPEYTAHRTEERRLMNLSRNLAIDAFVSTSYTSAGTKTPGVFVLSRSHPYVEQGDLPMLLARDSAIRNASICLATERAGADYLRSGYAVPNDQVRVMAEGDAAGAARELVSALVMAGNTPRPAEQRHPRWTVSKDVLISEFESPLVKGIMDQIIRNPNAAPFLDALHIIAWHCLTHRPRTYLEFAMHHPMLASLAAQLAVGIELYGCTATPLPPRPDLTSPTFEAAMNLQVISQTSLTRYAVASPEEFAAQLAEEASGPLELDLVVARPDPVAGDVLAQIKAVENHLGPNGAIVIAASTPAEFAALYDMVRRLRPDFTYFRMKRQTAALAIRTT